MFKQALAEMVERTEGATGALIMGMDGIAVERHFLPEGNDANMDIAATEVTSLVRGAMRAGSNTGLGTLEEMFVSYDRVRVLARMLSPEYYVVLTLGPEGNLGRGRYELRKTELRLARDLSPSVGFDEAAGAASIFFQQAGSFTKFMPRRMTRCRRCTRRRFFCGLKMFKGLGIIAERNAASLTESADAGLWK
jgi:predicted regulator of Ras-like GTPase activity (Roadblock/LC7/MglB family)